MRRYEALGFDPAPGEVAVVSDLLRDATAVKCELEYLQNKLASVGRTGSGWEGEAARAFARRVGELPRYLALADESANAARGALRRWAERLEAFQDDALRYEHTAAEAKAALYRAQRLVISLQAAVRSAPPDQRQATLEALEEAQRAADDARAQLDAAVSAARDLADDHREVAAGVADELRRAASFAPPEPGFFERIGAALDDFADFVTALPARIEQWVKDNAQLIKAIADVFADVATILGTVALFLPPPAGLVVGAIAAGAGALALGGHLLADWGGAEIQTLTYVADGLGIVGFGFGLIGGLGILGATAAKAGYAAKGQSGGVKMAEDALEYYGKVNAFGEAVGGVGTGAGTKATFDEGGIPFEHWVPRTPGQALVGAVSPAGLAFWNAAQDGMAKDRLREQGEVEAAWLR